MRYTKKIISFLLVLALLLSTVPMSVFAVGENGDVTEENNFRFVSNGDGSNDDAKTQSLSEPEPDSDSPVFSGTTGSCIWRLEGTKLIISGNGKMEDGDSPWGQSVTEVIIEDGVTSIGEDAFYNCTSLASVTIGNGVTSIGEDAFYNCTSLTSVTIGNGVTSIGTSAFYNCDSLDSIYITDIGAWCGISFEDYYSNPMHYAENVYLNGELLTDVVIPDGVTSIGDYAFFNCTFLTSLTIPASVTSIGEDAFYNCDSLDSIYITDIGAWCMLSCNGYGSDPMHYANSLYLNGELLTDVVIPDGVTNIRDGAFYNCDSLTSVVIPNGVTSIGKDAFNDCDSLASVTIGNGVTSIGDWAFSGCNKLAEVINHSMLPIVAGSYEYGYVGYYAIEVHNGESKIGKQNDYLFYLYNGMYYMIGYVGSDNCLVLPENYKEKTYSIAKNAFNGCDYLASITIPESVTSIGENAFSNCYKLAEVINHSALDLQAGSTDHGYVAYYAKEVHSGESKIEQQGDFLFYSSEGKNCLLGYCGRASELVLPANYHGNAYEINTRAFYDCNALKSITIPNCVTSIGESAFANCISLEDVYITDIGAWCEISFEDAFANPMLYAHNLYLNGKLLTAAVIPDGATSIGDFAFYNCTSLKRVSVPASVTSIGDKAFYNCTSLKSINIDPQNESYSFEDGVLFNKSKTVLLLCLCGKTGKYVIPESVASIREYAFKYCDFLSEVVIHPNVSYIDYNVFDEWGTPPTICAVTGSYAHEYAIDHDLPFTPLGEEVWEGTLLKYEYNPDGVTVIGIYSTFDIETVTIPEYTPDGKRVTSIGDYAFYYCDSLTSVTIPDSVTSIGDYAFYYCDSLTSVTIGNGVTSIGEDAFSGCTSLTSITIPDSVTSIGEDAFYNCDSLENLYITDIGAWCGISFENYYSNPMRYAENVYLNGELVTDLVIPYGVTRIGDHAFSGCTSLAGVMIPDGVTSIGEQAFYDCTALTSVTVPDSVTSIGSSAFSGCTSLTSVTIPDGVTSITDYAFSGCTSLTGVTIPDGVTSIGNYAFYNCTSLTGITIPDSVTSIGEYAFYGCLLTVVTIGKGVKSICENAFGGNPTEVHISDIRAWCGIEFADEHSNPLYMAERLYLNGKLIDTELVIPEGVTDIGKYAFCSYKGSPVMSVTLPSSLTSIGDRAFSGFSRLVEVINLSSLPIRAGSYGYGSVAENALEVHAGESKIENLNGFLFYSINNNNYLLGSADNAGLSTSLVLPDDYKEETYCIASYAFAGCDQLVSVTIPESVTSIEARAFSGCYRLVEVINHSSLYINAGSYYSNGGIGEYAIEVHTGESKIKERNGYLFYPYNGTNYMVGYAGSETDLVLPSDYCGASYEIHSYAFYDCDWITSVSTGKGATSIGYYAFSNCDSLIGVTIGRGLTSIGEYAFYYCTSLKDVTIGNSVTRIDDSAFSSCNKLTRMIIPANVSYISRYAFSYSYAYPDLTMYVYSGSYAHRYAIDYDFPFELIEQGGEAEDPLKYEYAPSGATVVGIQNGFIGDTVTIPAYAPDGRPVIAIGEGAFKDCGTLTSVIISEGVISIGKQSFCNCYLLEDVTIPGSVTRIGSYAFYGCDLYNVVIGENVNEIGYAAFDYDTVVYCRPQSAAEFFAKANGLEYAYYSDDFVEDSVNPYAFGGLYLISVDGTYGYEKDRALLDVSLYDEYCLTGYELEISDDNGENYSMYASVKFNTASSKYELNETVDFSEFDEGTAYVRLKVFDIAGNAETYVYSFVIDRTAPKGITSVACIPSEMGITLTWESEETGDDYKIVIYRSDSVDGDYRYCAILGASQRTYTDEDAMAGTEYYYYIVNVDDRNNSGEPSEIVSATRMYDTTKPAFTASVSNDDKDTCKLSFENIYDNVKLDRYTVEVSTDGGGVYRQLFGSELEDIRHYAYTAAQELDFSTYPEGFVFIRVTVFDAAGNSEHHVYVFEVDRTAPEGVVDFDGYSTEEYNYLIWDKSTREDDFDHFAIYRSESRGSFILIGEVTTLDYYDQTATAGIDYFYRVTAVDRKGNESEPSPTLSFERKTDFTAPELTDFLPDSEEELCGVAELKISCFDNIAMKKVVAEYRAEGEEEYHLIGKYNNWSDGTGFADIRWDISELEAGTYYVRYTLVDKSYNQTVSDDIPYTVVPYEAPVSPVLTATRGDSLVHLTWEYSGESRSLSGFEVFRRKKGETEYSLIATVYLHYGSLRNEYYDMHGENETEYEYKAVAISKIGDTAESNTVTALYAPMDLVAPVASVIAAVQNVAVDQNARFILSGSYDNVGITDYTIDFGDGTVLPGTTTADVCHRYTARGEYTVTLTVKDAMGNQGFATCTVRVLDPAIDTDYEFISFHVEDGEEGTSVGNIPVIVYDKESGESIQLFADENGGVDAMIKKGNYSVNAKLGDKIAKNLPLAVEDEGDIQFRVALRREAYLTGALVSREMTADEIAEAGIDTTDPDNRYVYERTVTFIYEKIKGEKEQFSYTYYQNRSGIIFNRYGGTFGGGGAGGGSGSSGSWGHLPVWPPYFVTPLGNCGNDDEWYLIVSGEAGCLKEMFEVTLLVINTSPDDWLENCTATLKLPEGLSLADMTGEEQSFTQILNGNGKIGQNDQAQVTWYVRGDAPGSFDISALVEGVYYPKPAEQVSKTFVTKNPIVVRDMTNALELAFEDVPRYAKQGEKVHITLRATNKLDVPLNYVTLKIKCRGVTDELDVPITELLPGEDCTVGVDITFPFSTKTVGYLLKDAVSFNSTSVPAAIYYDEESDDNEIHVDITAWEDFDGVSEWKNSVTALSVGDGSFSWKSLKENDQYNYDKLYLKVSVKNEGTSSEKANCTVRITAPDGFSFSSFHKETEHTITVEELPVGMAEYISVPIYPIYSMGYNDGSKAKFEVAVNSDCYGEGNKVISVFHVNVRKNSGKLRINDYYSDYEVSVDSQTFQNVSGAYNIKLAQLGAALSGIGSCKESVIKESLVDIGFSHFEECKGGIIAKKRVYVGENIQTLIVVINIEDEYSSSEIIQAVRELASIVTDGILGESFINYTLNKTLVEKIAQYISENTNGNAPKLFITGYGNGGAAANLIGAAIDQGALDGLLSADNTIVYTFGSPNTTTQKDCRASMYDNIVNIVDHNDIYTLLWPQFLGNYDKYGQTYAFSYDSDACYYAENIKRQAVFNYQKYSGRYYNVLDETLRDLITLKDFNLKTFLAKIALKQYAGIDIDEITKNIENMINDYGEKKSVELTKLIAKEMSIELSTASAKFILGGLTTLRQIIDTIDQIDQIICTHSIENYQAWVNVLDEGGILYYEPTLDYHLFELLCPVDVEIYDSDGALIAKTENDLLVESEYFVPFIAQNGHKIFVLNGSEEYTVKIIGYEGGSMDVVVTDYCKGVPSTVTMFNDVPISSDSSFTMIVEYDEIRKDSSHLTLQENNGNTVLPDVVSDYSELKKAKVSIQISGIGETIGEGEYISGEAVVLKAIPNHSKFLGWYNGEQLLSTETSYCFICSGDINIEARFTETLYYAVSGSITSFGKNGNPVNLSLYDGEKLIETVTSDDGKYQFESVVSGNYQLKVSANNHVTRTYDVTVGDADVTQDVKLHLLGDINGDGKVNITDVNKANAHANKTKLLTGYEFDCANINGDDKVNITDVNKINAHANKSKYLW